MNSRDIQFSAHDGDLTAENATQGSIMPTSRQSAVQPTIHSQALRYFTSLDETAIFTPCDNDWTGGSRISSGAHTPLSVEEVS